ncbi:hypothetical protein MMC07_006795 [Pseudocyphellaria aurata]|nr:hypothetical protein [Pseudocyphellaria aurata]
MNEKTGKSTGKTTSTDPSDSTSRYIRAAAYFDESRFKRIGLPDKCFKLLQKYPLMIKYYNRDPHGTEQAFATLLMKDQHRKLRSLWEPYLEYCFKKTVETLAREEQELIDSIYDGLL